MVRQQPSKTPDPNRARDKNQGTRSQGQIVFRAAEDQNSRRRTISFSSEEPYQRWFGMEILDHSDGAMDLSRLNEVGVVLFNHNTDKVLGRVLRAWVENRRGMAEIEFDTDDDAENDFRKGQGRNPENHVCPLCGGQLGGSGAGQDLRRRTFHRPVSDCPEMDPHGGFHCVRTGRRHRGRWEG
nr:MAG TPA: major capsid protein [Caudoviricetes sp.]